MMKKRTAAFNGRKLMCLLLAIVTVLAFAGCGSGGKEFEIISAIDMNSVTETEYGTMFTAVDEEGKSIRFEGIGIEVTDAGLVMKAGAMLVSLDYIGQIKSITPEAEGIERGAAEYGMQYGFAFADVPSVDGMMQLKVGLPEYLNVGFDSDVSGYNTGFVALRADWSNPESITVNKLTVVYNAKAPQVKASELDPESEVMQLLANGYLIDWNMEEAHLAAADPNAVSLKKIEDPNTISSDIVAGIDHGSIVKDGDTVFFSSVMSDGAVVRFEGFHIDIAENGITIYPDSKITSLDAIGKIYAYAPIVENYASYPQNTLEALDFGYGYTYSAAKTSVERAYEVHTWGISGLTADLANGENIIGTAVFEPNFVYILGYAYCENSIVLNNIKVYYDPAQKVTAIREVLLNTDMSGSYMEGDIYDPSREETADPYKTNLSFYLKLVPDTEEANPTAGYSIWSIPSAFYEVGAMRDANGNEVDKRDPMKAGYTLDIAVGDSNLKMDLPIVERYEGAATMNDLVPYAFPAAIGDMDTLVVPVAWADQTEMANDATLNNYKKGVGRVVDANGKVTDYSDMNDEKYSLSEYYDIASYGKLRITSFMTDWYYSDRNFADIWQSPPDDIYANEIMDWVRATYPDMDWSRYDKDANGYIDSMIILNAGVYESDEIYIMSYSGAIHYRHTYYGDHAGTPDAPRVNSYVTVGNSWMQDDYSTLIHEYAHILGIIDYYDVSYSGIDAVGKLDMQSANCGDWNCYSKLAVGWMEPTVVEGLASGESREYTIGSSALTNDVILIPAAGKGYEGPFSEYVMADLLTMDGVNEHGTEDFDLKGTDGVRISHVNAKMEKRTMTINSVTNPGASDEYTIGTVHCANNYNGSILGKYNIEVIQAGGDNTFTDFDNLDPILDKNDLFYAGDTFSAKDYDEFFYNGLMDDGSEFGYEVEVVSIGKDAQGEPSATIRVTAK